MKASYRSMGGALALGVLIAAVAAEPLKWPSVASVELPQSSGKFDFLRVDENRGRLLAAHVQDGTSDFIDLKSHSLIARVKVGGAVDTAVDVESRFYYVSVQDAGRVAVLDAATLKEVNSIKTTGPTDAILYEPKNHRVYVTHDEGADLWVIDPQAAKVVASVVIPGVPEALVYDASPDRLYLNIKSKDLVAVIDPSSNAVIAQWPTAPATRPHGLALDPAGHRIFSAGANGKLVAIDTRSGAIIDSTDIAAKVDQIALDAAGGLLYCAGAGEISVVRVGSGQLSLLGELPTAPGARNVAVDPASRAVWTTYSDGKSSFAKGWSAPQR
ncbi:MAG: YncE family protein [Gammaproteobacteria bacterium]|nr:YncE family protein [Gammaproteobacteria bacterium]MBV8403109.1 YncE family protein [Gammaproteobacteria bacterium]